MRNLIYCLTLLGSLFFLIGEHAGLVFYTPYTAILVVCLTIAAFFFFYKNNKSNANDISEKSFRYIVSACLLTVFILEVIIFKSHIVDINSDSIYVKNQAEFWLENNSLRPDLSEYFYMYPNNVNISLLFTWLLKIFGSFDAIVIITILATNITALLTTLSARVLTKSNSISLVILFCFQIFSILTTRTYWPYTSNPGILCVALIFYLYVKPMKLNYKIILLPLAAALGYFVKMTVLIPCIAIAIIEVYRVVARHNNVTIKYIILSLLSVVFFFGCEETIRIMAWNHYGYEYNEHLMRGLSYFTYLGQYTPAGGQWDEYVSSVVGCYEGTGAERDAYFYDLAYQSLMERGILGNIKFYVTKTAICFGYTGMDMLNTPFLSNVFYFIRHAIWYFVMTGFLLSTIFFRDKREYMAFLTVVGVLFYLLISEISFTYVIMFCPVIFAGSAVFLKNVGSVKKQEEIGIKG